MKNLAYLIILALFAAPIYAAEEEKDDSKVKHEGSVELGFVNTTGNTDNTTMDFKFNSKVNYTKWSHEFIANAFFTSPNDETTGERYLAAYRGRRAFAERDSVFVLVRYTDDRFSGFKYQTSAFGGYGRHVLIGPKHFLDAEIGAGYRQDETTEGETNNEAVAQLNGNYKYVINDRSNFVQDIFIISGSSNTEVASFTGLKVNINKTLALSLGYDLKHNTNPPEGKEKTDGKTTANIVYNF
jgi:putative salt-induced outer membrane protein